MEEDVLNALQTRTVYLPGGFDRNGKVIFIVNIVNDLQSWQRKCLELSVTYLKRSLRLVEHYIYIVLAKNYYFIFCKYIYLLTIFLNKNCLMYSEALIKMRIFTRSYFIFK